MPYRHVLSCQSEQKQKQPIATPWNMRRRRHALLSCEQE